VIVSRLANPTDTIIYDITLASEKKHPVIIYNKILNDKNRLRQDT
jgi:hypothetical protein